MTTVTLEGGRCKIIDPPTVHAGTGRPQVWYPKSDSYEWQEFAGLVIEFGGYGDITAVNPYNGVRFWMRGEHIEESFYDQMRELLNAMERHHELFLSKSRAVRGSAEDVRDLDIAVRDTIAQYIQEAKGEGNNARKHA